MANQTLNVEGMTCDHCVQTIKEAVNNLVGISRVEVDLENKQVAVEYDKALVKLDSITDKIVEIGFNVI
ncbi:MAG: copper ion binding protein [Nitrospinales bacterium]|nr:copper ion binding protein [Nitrospinales bacterium]